MEKDDEHPLMTNMMNTCTLCPRSCGIDRTRSMGFCHASLEPEVASICVHKGEEPPICGEKGICNVFFAHCNLQCIYCQNRDISRGVVDSRMVFYHGLKEVCDRIEAVLGQTENIVGFVSPSHYAFCVPDIVEELHRRGLFPTVVYNTGGYDSVETLRMVAPYVDVYLPDFKYMDGDLAARYSHAPDYPERAGEALKEMFSQKGSGLPVDDDGLAYRGIILRHLILPGQVDNSLKVLDWIADNLSLNLHIALMSQYTPPEDIDLPDELNRTLTREEYDRVVEHFYDLGFHKGWVQDFSSQQHYQPHFSEREAFEGSGNNDHK